MIDIEKARRETKIIPLNEFEFRLNLLGMTSAIISSADHPFGKFMALMEQQFLDLVERVNSAVKKISQ